MRVFTAIPLTDSARKEIVGLQRELSASKTHMKLVEEENLHITLNFFGEKDDEEVRRVAHVLEGIHDRAFDTVLDRVGAFPSEEHIRVLWVGCSSENIKKIHDFIQVNTGLPKEECIPHATIARVKDKPDQAMSKVLAKKVSIPLHVSRVLLMKSILTPEGPKYEEVHSIELR
ncbi:MAG: RNA 2',3'-cyclic phosphodiesterase [Candidatus Diapherotrites archaeon]|nr:RNA 2',3'-cyclic phosphodiesterase [Candidatus Diapherotrites archaeon]